LWQSPTLNRSSNNSCFILGLALGVLVTAAVPARAASVRTRSGIGYDGKIVDLNEDGLVVDVGGSKQTVPLADVSKIDVDAFPDVGKAEEAFAEARKGGEDAKTHFAEAERLYKGTLSPKAPTWLRVLAQLRLSEVYGQAGRVAMALDAYLGVARAQPKLIVGILLPEPREGDPDNPAMLTKVEAALKDAAGKPYESSLKLFLVSLTLVQGNPDRALTLVRELRKSDDPKTQQWATLRELEILVAAGKLDEAEPMLKDLAKQWESRSPGLVSFWEGRLLEGRKEYMAAALAFMRVAVLHAAEDRAMTAEALWRAGQAMEAAKAPAAEVQAVYEEAVSKYAGTVGAERAGRELARLNAQK